MLKCQISLGVEYKELQSRIEKANSLVEVLQKKFERMPPEREGGGDHLKCGSIRES
jgi:hypothetical protein